MASRVIQENTRHTARRATNSKRKTILVLPKTCRRKALRSEVVVGGVTITILLQETGPLVSFDIGVSKWMSCGLAAPERRMEACA